MPCPYFCPVEALAWPSAPRLPLGDAYTGTCQSDPAHPISPAAADLRDLCNLGYAAGRCARFPLTGGPDAIRFCAAKDAGGLIHIAWARERDHYPFDNGILEYSTETGRFTAATPHPIVGQQAQAYVSSYLRRTRRES